LRRPPRVKRPVVKPRRKPKPKLKVFAPAPPAVLPAAAARPAPNTTCDIYHAGATPPTPSVAEVALHLSARFQAGAEASEGDSTFRWTHLGMFEASVDLRDNYPSAPNSTLQIPSTGGTVFDIVFVELVNRGLPSAYKRVFLDRQEPTWPTDQL